MQIRGTVRYNLTNRWVNPKYFGLKSIIRFKKRFISSKPFNYLELNNFLDENKATAVLNALSKEKFREKESDLFKFRQTNDLAGTNQRILQEFRDFLYSTEFISLMEHLTGFKLKNTVDMAGTLYQDTDYLLCHDDQLEGRRIAYLFYLSDMKESDGGSLNLFASKNKITTKIEKKIIPKFNTFAFFEVSPASFHEVAEVVVKKQRIAIGGWFYGR